MNNRHGKVQRHINGRIQIMTFLMTSEWKTLGWWECVMAVGPNTVRNSPPVYSWSMLVLRKNSFEILTWCVMKHQSYTCSLIANPLSGRAAPPPRWGKERHKLLEAFWIRLIPRPRGKGWKWWFAILLGFNIKIILLGSHNENPHFFPL